MNNAFSVGVYVPAFCIFPHKGISFPPHATISACAVPFEHVDVIHHVEL